MKKFLLFFFIVFFGASRLFPQDSTRVSESTTEENIALITMTGIIIPLALIGTVVSAAPPSAGVVVKNGTSYGAMTIETGVGTGDFRQTGIFSDWRLAFSYTYVVSASVRDFVRGEIKRDFHFEFVDRRKIFLSGFHVSAGLLTDFPEDGYSIGAGGWVKSPWLNYFGFFPQHTFGITYRYNKYFGGTDFHEITLGVASSFTF